MPTFSKVIRLLVAFFCLGAAIVLLRAAGLPERAAFSGFLNDDGLYVAPEIGAIAPSFTLLSPAQRKFTLQADGVPATLLTFWATWCPPCQEELQQLQAIYESNSASLRIIAINLGESPTLVAEWVQALGLTYDVLLDPLQSVAKRYRIRGQPTTVLLDAQLRIHHVYYGAFSRDHLLRTIAYLARNT